MDSDDLSFLPLRVIRVGVSGKRTYDPEGKRRLIAWCRTHPRASISRTALKAGINTNQLRKWIRDQDVKAVIAPVLPAPSMSTFVPVVTINTPPTPTASETLPRRHELTQPSAPRARLSARLPNGTVIELECASQDAPLVKAMIVALGVS